MTRRPPVRTMGLLIAHLVTKSLGAQSAGDCWSRPDSAPPHDTARAQAALGRRVMVGTRLTTPPPTIDGRIDDPLWCAAPPVTDFVQSRPSPGAIAVLPTMARVLYDDRSIYVAVRLFDPHPDRIVAPYPRRDDETTSDWLFLEIDSRLDHRSGFSFGLNPRGIQVDGTWSDDVNYDPAWNGVWESGARIDSLGWTAVYRIPFSQLALGRSRTGEPLVWGINFYRHAASQGETSNWSPRLPTVVGVVSHFNEIQGLTVPPRHLGFELLPYAAVVEDQGSPSPFTVRAGGDLHFRPTATTTVAVSAHPDFGQVEADPSLVNLTTFETFLPEQRPLFVDEASVFQFPSTISYASRGTGFDQESPFYSRRIGAPPRGGCPTTATVCSVPLSTDLLGAARVSTRTSSGWSGGLLQAWSGPEDAHFVDSAGVPRKVLAEPLTSFTVARSVREFANGAAAVGVMGTFVDRLSMRDGVDSLLPNRALVIGADGRTRFANDRFELSGFALASRLDGSAAAIDSVRANPRHGYNRPDTAGGPNPGLGTATSLSGLTTQARLAQLDGRWQWGLAGRMVSRGFEANDVGFERNADWLLAEGFWSYQVYRPGHTIRRWSVGSSQLGIGWTTGGLRRSAVVNAQVAADFSNYWGGSISWDHEFSASDPEMLRGGPALLLPPQERWTATAYTDTRRRWQMTLTLTGSTTPAIPSHDWSVTPHFTAFLSDRLQVDAAPSYSAIHQGWQYVAQPQDARQRRHYVLGGLSEKDATLTLRATYAISERLTLQLYAQPFLSGGTYRDFREVTAPAANQAENRAASLTNRIQYDGATRTYVVDKGLSGQFAFDDPAFSERDFHLNFVVRWECAPGSALFLIWTQERSDQEVQRFAIASDIHRLWLAPSRNVLTAKLSYWIGR